MTQADDPRPAVEPQTFWLVLMIANLASLLILMVAFHFMSDVALSPELGRWFLFAGGALSFPAVLYQLRCRQLNSQLGSEISINARKLKQLNQLVLSCALAVLPGLMATVYYLFTREWLATGVLLMVAVVLLLRGRPAKL